MRLAPLGNAYVVGHPVCLGGWPVTRPQYVPSFLPSSHNSSGRGAGEVMQMGALLSPMMGAWGEGGAAADEGPKLKERAFIPDAWDDSDDDDDDETEGGGVTTETESATVQGSTNSLAGLADGAWNSEDDEDEDDAATA